MITVLKNEYYNYSHLWHSKFSFMLSETVDSTSKQGKKEWYGSFLVKKSKLNGKGCGFDCTKCQTGFWFANLKTGVVHILMLSHTAAFMEFIFFSLFKSMKFWQLLILQNSLPQVCIQKQKAAETGISLCPFLATHFWPIHQVRHLYVHFTLIFLFFSFPILNNCPHNG